MQKLSSILSCMLLITASVHGQENFFMYTVGDYTVVLLSEGQGQGNPSILIDAGQDILDKYIPTGTFPNATNAFLVLTPDRTVLIDTGYGGNLFDNFEALAITAGRIDAVMLTHMHGDHIGGMLRDGEPAFASAKKVAVSRMEHAYWASEGEMNKVAENRRGGFLNSQKVFDSYAGVLDLVDPFGIDAMPRGDGIFPIEAYGHTPGHVGFMVVSKGERLLVWGDLTHAMAVQMPRPEIAVTYDVDPETAVQSRLRILEYVAKHEIPVAGMHIAYPSIGNVVPNGEGGYTFVPAE